MTPELSAIQEVIQRNRIIDIIVRIANAIDAKEWQRLRQYLADEIEVDYSAFQGELPQRMSAEAYIQQRIGGLAGLKTLHISTNHEVVVNGDNAYCRSAYRIYRFHPLVKQSKIGSIQPEIMSIGSFKSRENGE